MELVPRQNRRKIVPLYGRLGIQPCESSRIQVAKYYQISLNQSAFFRREIHHDMKKTRGMMLPEKDSMTEFVSWCFFLT